jgi:uncharacterized protein YuzE
MSGITDKVKVADWYFDSAEFDSENDVLYLSIGKPRPGYGEETPEGHVLRYDEEGEFCGLTLIGVQGMLQAGRHVKVTVPPKTEPRHSWVPMQDLKRILA